MAGKERVAVLPGLGMAVSGQPDGGGCPRAGGCGVVWGVCVAVGVFLLIIFVGRGTLCFLGVG